MVRGSGRIPEMSPERLCRRNMQQATAARLKGYPQKAHRQMHRVLVMTFLVKEMPAEKNQPVYVVQAARCSRPLLPG